MLSIIVAKAKNNVIGKNDELIMNRRKKCYNGKKNI